MTINAINNSQTAFKGKAYTDNGNVFNRTNAFRAAGALIGAGVATYGIVNRKAIMDNVMEKINKSSKMKKTCVGVFAALTLAGLAVGSIGDKIINGIRKRSSDNKALKNK